MNQDKYFYQQGIKKVKEDNLYDAIEDFNQAIALNSDFVDVYKQRGQTYLSLGNTIFKSFYPSQRRFIQQHCLAVKIYYNRLVKIC